MVLCLALSRLHGKLSQLGSRGSRCPVVASCRHEIYHTKPTTALHRRRGWILPQGANAPREIWLRLTFPIRLIRALEAKKSARQTGEKIETKCHSSQPFISCDSHSFRPTRARCAEMMRDTSSEPSSVRPKETKKSLLHKKGPLISAPIVLCFYYDSLIIAHQRERQTPIMSGSPNRPTIAKDLKT